MSRGQSRKARAEERARKKRQKQIIRWGGLGLGALILGWIVFNAGGSPTPEVPQARLDTDPVLGNESAPVTIIEYGAYSCSACRRFHELGIIDRIMEDYGDQVRFVFRDFPVISPAYDVVAAQAAQCAFDQDEALFWAYHNALYTSYYMTNGTSAQQYGDLGTLLGFDGAELEACVDSRQHLQTVRYDENRARDLGLNATPSIFVNDQRVFNPSYEELRRVIEGILEG